MTDVKKAATATVRSRWLPFYLALVVTFSVATGVVSWVTLPQPALGPLLLLSLMGVVSFHTRGADPGVKIGFSFISIILVASAALVGVFGAWVVGTVSVLVDRRQPRLSATMFNAAMSGLLGVAAASTYRALGGATGTAMVGMNSVELGLRVGLPLFAADVVACVVNALLLAGVMHLDSGVPLALQVRRVLSGTGVAYVGYGVIGLLFVILWFPAGLGAFSAILVLAPLLAARWAFIQYGEELRSHERTVDTLVTALGTKEPAAVEHSRRTADLAEWIAEELGLAPAQIGTVRYTATLHEIGHLGVPTRLLRRAPGSLNPRERRVIEGHCIIGAHMIEGIDFLEDASSGIRHQCERFDGTGRPDGLGGAAIPIAARVVAVAAAIEDVLREPEVGVVPRSDVETALRSDIGRFDPEVVDAALVALDKHRWSASSTAEVVS